jgi:two-component system chemotaxis response regulator CheB
MSISHLAPAVSAAPLTHIRVMVVDDSAVVRGLISRWLNEDPGTCVVALARTGREAVDQLDRADPHVVILDIEMPELDGISALPLLLAKKPNLVVIMASTLTRRNAEISIKALSLGAADYVPKPETNRGVTTCVDFRQSLVTKVRELGSRALRRSQLRSPEPGRPVLAPGPFAGVASRLVLRPATARPRVLLIAASTGGPQALMSLAPHLAPVLEVAPIFITQHMPPTFTTILAEHLARVSGGRAREALDGEAVEPGMIYVAPGGRHMRVGRDRGALPVVRLDDGPAVNFCKPAVDPLFTSASAVWGSGVLAVVLTGMGADGTNGARDIVAAGGAVIAQDEATSVVWGMPGSVANAGLCAAVLPLDQIPARAIRMFARESA